MKKKILISGTSGFIGYECLKYLLKNKYDITVLLRNKNKFNKKFLNLNNNYPKFKKIFFSAEKDLKIKLKNRKIDIFINFSNYYVNSHNFEDISKLINANVIFPTLVLDLISNKCKKVINFGTMMQHPKSKKLDSLNLYAATKNSFDMIFNYYKYKYKSCNFYNIKFYESFGKNDYRKKLLPTLLKNIKKNKLTKIFTSKLVLNIIHIEDIFLSLDILFRKKIKSGSYCLFNKKNISIKNLINSIKLKNKIKINYMSNKKFKIPTRKIKKLPGWNSKIDIKKKFLLNLNENN